MEINMDKKVTKKLRRKKKEKNMNINEETPAIEEKKQTKKEIAKVTKNAEIKPGIGLDIGTMNLLSARAKDDEISFKRQRDAFFGIDNGKMERAMLDKLDASYIVSPDEKNLFIIGDKALEIANFFKKDIKRPLERGVISTTEKEALLMIKEILHGVLGDPIEENEVCHFSVPAKPIDENNYNTVYHENLLKSFVSSFGYNAIPLNEALAIIWAEMSDDEYTGLALSFGAGMVNCALGFMGISKEEHQFSVARSGDWIDMGAAAATGTTAANIIAIKENGVDLLAPKTREEQAIAIYYENLIKYVCNGLEKKLNNNEETLSFPQPINVVVSGGTSKAINFEKVFEKELKTKTFPFQINSVRKAKQPLQAVAKGCLMNSLNS